MPAGFRANLINKLGKLVFCQWLLLFLGTKSLNWPSSHNSLTQSLLYSWKCSRLLKVFKDACHTWLQLIFGELIKPGCFPTSYTVVKEASWSWLVPTLKDLSAKFLSHSLQPHACSAVSCGLHWDSFSVSKPRILTKVQLVVRLLKGFPGSCKIGNLSSNDAKNKLVISWGTLFPPHQTPDSV